MRDNIRIIGHGLENPEQLLAHPHNVNTHPNEQRDALRASLDRLGWISSIKVNQNTGHLIDGHARVEQAITDGTEEIPVEYLDLTEEEELEALAYFDAIGRLAGTNQENLEYILETIELDSEPLENLLDKNKTKPEKKSRECPHCGKTI
jgi:ParB-like chromosome segregation protein Spo0J